MEIIKKHFFLHIGLFNQLKGNAFLVMITKDFNKNKPKIIY